MSEGLLVNYLTNYNNDINKLLDIIKTVSGSEGYALYINDGRVLSNKDSDCFDHTEFFDTVSLYIKNNDHENLVLIPSIKYKLCLFGNQNGYNESIEQVTKPFINLLNILVEDETCGDMFLVNMSHEIRTPLNGVIGYSQLLNQTEMNSKQKSYSKSLSECSLQLMQIINDVLDVSRLNSGKMGLSVECFSIKEVEETIRKIMGQRIYDKKQTIVFENHSNLPSYIVTDKQKLTQIMINLVSNAHKFSNINGKINIKFSLHDEHTIKFSVSDNGSGIKESKLCDLFKTFVQLHDDTKNKGSGLGLAICKKLCVLMGGNISVESKEGKGATFTCFIKFKKCEEAEQEIQSEAIQLMGRKVLVVDDNADNRILLSEQLYEWNMKPMVVASAKEAMSLVTGTRHKFDIGIIDICMPEISGTELAKQIKEQRPLLPLIALSSLDYFCGSNDFEGRLDKPVNKVQLFDKISRVLNNNNNLEDDLTTIIEEDSSDVSSDSSSSPSSRFKKNCKILVAEDVEYNQDILKEMLQKFGYKNVDTANNGQEAVDLIKESHDQKSPYGILLLDLQMPVMDGYTVIDTVNENQWTLPKIIVVTASVIQKEREKCREKGVNYFIKKPIEINELKKCILESSIV